MSTMTPRALLSAGIRWLSERTEMYLRISQEDEKLLMAPTGYKMIRPLSAIILIYILGTYIMYLWLDEQESHGLEHTNITILLWHWPFSRTSRLSDDTCMTAYGVPGCRLLDNRSLLHQADVVVFHHNELKLGISKLPLDQPRPPAQRWVWMSLESPVHNGKLSAYNGLFNWTLTYRRDADIFTPYGELVPGQSKGDLVVPRKHFLACWVVSNYQRWHRRSEVCRQLQKQIPLHVFGRQSGRPLEPSQLLPTISRCHFYLAFENSESRDYITEKLWRNSFQAGAVPVVLGPTRHNYESLVPAHSFIHIDDFNSTEELGTFLTRLASDEERYRSYFRWQRDFTVKLYEDWRERLCRICSRYKHLPPNKVYHDLDSWLNQDQGEIQHGGTGL